MSNSSNNKRIAKNTILLYIRMFILMLVSLYTSRVVLNALGVEDYGIYNVVGGVVTMFSVLSSSLSTAISRFITVELGKGDVIKLKKIFSTSINVQIILIVLITLLLETVGLWYLNSKMVIPLERINAANWVFQFSVLTFAINLWSVPYNAFIIAHEKMSAFAYISIFDAIAKLGIAFLIIYSPYDKLVIYSILIMLTGFVQRLLYSLYCKKHFNECRYELTFDRTITKEMFIFSGWNFIGSSSAILRDQGGNLLINFFFGPTVNAARGIALSVNSAVSGFVANFMMALNPQITKNYANGNFEYMFKLAFQGARLSYYIFFLLTLPIMFTASYILELWLGVVPEYTPNFVCWVLIFTLSECLASPLITIMLATGNIRNYQLIVGGVQLMNLPVSYVLLRLGYPADSVFIVAVIFSVVCEFVRLLMLRNMVGLPIRKFIKEVYLNVVSVSVLSSLIPYILLHFFELNCFAHFIIIVSITLVNSLLVIYFIGCSKHDREIVNSAIRNVIKKIKNA